MASANGSTEAMSDVTSVGGAPISFAQEVVITVIITVLGLWTTIGNVVTILAITTVRLMRTKTNMFLLSLAISDLLSGAVASPLWLYRRTWGFSEWELSQFVCKLYWFVDEATSYCTSLHIASFAVWRFILVKWPHKVRRVKFRTIIIWTSVIWVVSIVFGGFVFSSFTAAIKKTKDGSVVSTVPMCSVDVPRLKVFLKYYIFSSAFFMLLPMTILFVMSALIAKLLLVKTGFKSNTRKAKENQAVAQLAMIAVSFMVGYIPIITYQQWTIRTRSPPVLDYWVGVGVYFSLRFSESMNPILYNIASNKMRRASKTVLSQIRGCHRQREDSTPSKYTHSSEMHSRSKGLNVSASN